MQPVMSMQSNADAIHHDAFLFTFPSLEVCSTNVATGSGSSARTKIVVSVWNLAVCYGLRILFVEDFAANVRPEFLHFVG